MCPCVLYVPMYIACAGMYVFMHAAKGKAHREGETEHRRKREPTEKGRDIEIYGDRRRENE